MIIPSPRSPHGYGIAYIGHIDYISETFQSVIWVKTKSSWSLNLSSTESEVRNDNQGKMELWLRKLTNTMLTKPLVSETKMSSSIARGSQLTSTKRVGLGVAKGLDLMMRTHYQLVVTSTSKDMHGLQIYERDVRAGYLRGYCIKPEREILSIQFR